ncbi:MAG: hypothetical protein EI684_22895, partial [Candidatus Viridilinea halotolerans]
AVICAQERLRAPERTRMRDAYGWPTCPFPIFIPLRALRDAATTQPRPLLVSYAQTLREMNLLGTMAAELPDTYFQQRAKDGGCIILLDAFDELRDAAARQRLAKLVADLPTGPPNAPNRIVVTSRIFGYEGQLHRWGFVTRLLARLTPDQVRDFIHQRYRVLARIRVGPSGLANGQRWNPETRAQRLISRLDEDSGLQRLVHNPFLLSLIISVHFKSSRELPRQRHALYAKAMEQLVDEWERLKDGELELEPTTLEAELEAEEKLALLRELAWAMFERNLAGGDARSHTVITSTAAEDVLTLALRDIPRIATRRSGTALDTFSRSEAKRWLRQIGERGGVLQELGNVEASDEVQIQFAHQTFQEYLASQSIHASIPAVQHLRTNRVRERWHDRRWREVLLLFSATSVDASPTVSYLLEQGTPDADLMAGAILAEQPRRLDNALIETTLSRVTHLVLAAEVALPTALEALNILAETGLDPVERVLGRAALTAPQRGVRVRALELLARMEPNRPAPAPIAPHIQNLMRRILAHEQESRLRLAAGFALARSDPRPCITGLLPEMVHIPAGPFLMGSTAEDADATKDEKPQHTLTLPDYWIGKTLVTNAQWQRFIDAGGYRTRRYWSGAGWRWLRSGWEPKADYTTAQALAVVLLGPLFDPLVRLLLRRPPFSQPHPESWDDPAWNGANQPVTGISFYEAAAYCRWLSEATDHPFHLPTEAEWEKAARGPEGLIYPWGNTWEAGRCNSEEAGLHKPAPVGSYQAGTSPYGVHDMAGNVWEWCATPFRMHYAWRKPDWSERLLNVVLWWLSVKAIRGGSYFRDRTIVRGAYRNNYIPRYRGIYNGLRVVSHAPVVGSDE